jgi:hypothetical protein
MGTSTDPRQRQALQAIKVTGTLLIGATLVVVALAIRSWFGTELREPETFHGIKSLLHKPNVSNRGSWNW